MLISIRILTILDALKYNFSGFNLLIISFMKFNFLNQFSDNSNFLEFDFLEFNFLKWGFLNFNH